MNENLIISKDISGWLMRYDWTCYLNQKNNFGLPIFHTEGGGSKCDLIAKKANLTLGIEIKVGDAFQNILDGFQQTIEYAGEYYGGDIEYQINNKTIDIDSFLIATKYSPNGFLYANDNEFKTLNLANEFLTGFDVGEKPITFTFTRLLWRMWNKGSVRDYYEQRRIGNKTNGRIPTRCPKIGILVARIKRSTQEISNEPWQYVNNNIFQNLKSLEALQYD